jgi:hypothetical protein
MKAYTALIHQLSEVRSAVPIAFFLVKRGIVDSLDEAYQLARERMPRPHFLIVAAFAMTVAGCATTQDHADAPQINDPVEGLNFGTK